MNRASVPLNWFSDLAAALYFVKKFPFAFVPEPLKLNIPMEVGLQIAAMAGS